MSRGDFTVWVDNSLYYEKYEYRPGPLPENVIERGFGAAFTQRCRDEKHAKICATRAYHRLARANPTRRVALYHTVASLVSESREET